MTRKRMNNYKEIYDNGKGKRTLEECYSKPSYYKRLALDNCLKIVRDFSNTSSPRILTYNTFMFTVGFYVRTPSSLYFVVITKTGVHMKEIK